MLLIVNVLLGCLVFCRHIIHSFSDKLSSIHLQSHQHSVLKMMSPCNVPRVTASSVPIGEFGRWMPVMLLYWSRLGLEHDVVELAGSC